MRDGERREVSREREAVERRMFPEPDSTLGLGLVLGPVWVLGGLEHASETSVDRFRSLEMKFFRRAFTALVRRSTLLWLWLWLLLVEGLSLLATARDKAPEKALTRSM